MYMYFSIGGGTSWHWEWWWRTTNLQSSQVANGLGWQAYPLLAVQATWPWAGNYLSYLGVGSIFPSSLFPLVVVSEMAHTTNAFTHGTDW